MTGPALSLDRIEQIARDTVAGFPAPFRDGARDVAIVVADWPDAGILHDLGLAVVGLMLAALAFWINRDAISGLAALN